MESREGRGGTRSRGDALDGTTHGTRLVEHLFSHYVDRLNAGEILDADAIRARHPEVAGELLEQLEDFESLGSDDEAARERETPGALGILGDYTLRRQIGRGGMAVVYEAWQNSMKRRVALKVLPAGIAADAKASTRFMREAQAAGKLHHQNVVTVHAMGVDEHTPYYAMEYVEGETLARILDRLRSGPETESSEEERTLVVAVTELFGRRVAGSSGSNGSVGLERGSSGEAERSALRVPSPDGRACEVNLKYCLHVAEAFAGVADGLQHAHSRGIVHRDIKPSNLILDREHRLRILDFGLARFEGQETLTMSGDLIGTVLYMSPEQAMAKRMPMDHRTDIYSLGATLYEMLAWRAPFQGATPQATLSQVVLDEPSSISRGNRRLPKDLETIVLKCLRKNPADRYGTAEALAQDLRRFVRGDPIEARPQSRWERAVRQTWRHRLRLGAVVMTVLFFLSAVFLWLGYRRELEAEKVVVYRELILEALGKLEGRFSDYRSQKVSKRDSAKAYLLGESPLAATRGRIAGVLEQLQAAARLCPDRPEAYYYRARALLEIQREEDALQALDVAEQVDPDFVPARTLRGALYETQGKQRLATREQRTEAWRANDPWAKAWHRAQTAFRDTDWAAAEVAYGELIRMDQQHGDAHPAMSLEVRMGRGIARLELREYENAIRDFATASDRWPTALSPGLMLGYSYLFLGGSETAEQWFEEFIERFPTADGEARDEAAFAIVTTFLAWGDTERALAWLDRVRAEPLRRRSRILLLIRAGRASEALDLARTVADEEQDDPLLLASAALALSRRGKYGAARSLLARAEMVAEGARTMPATHLAEAYTDVELRGQALEWAQRGFEKEPRDVAACNTLAWTFFTAGQTTRALEVCGECVRLAPMNMRAHQIMGECYLRLRKLDEAYAATRRALEFADEWSPYDRSYARALYCFGRVHELRGDLRTAEDLYRRAIAASSDYLFQRDFGGVLMARGEYDEALQAFLAAFREATRPGHISRVARRFSGLLRGGPRSENLESLDEISDILARLVDRSRIPWVIECYALTLLYAPGRRDPYRALPYAERALKLAGESGREYLITLAAAQVASGDRGAAIRTLERGVDVPESTWLTNFAQLETILEQERAAYLPAIASYDSVDAIVSRESDLESLCRHLEEYRDADSSMRDPALEGYFRGRLLQRQGEHRDAVEALETVVELDPSPAPRLRLAVSLAAIGELEAAKAYLGDTLRGTVGGEELLWRRWSAAEGQALLSGLLPLADSFFDWSTRGEQGHRGWFSGYYNRTLDPDGTYDADDFILFQNTAGPEGGTVEPGGNHWSGFKWQLLPNGGPWTKVGRVVVEANGRNSSPGEEHWGMRRWVSDSDAALTVTWSVRKITTGDGNGVTAHLFHNGVERDSATIAFNDAVGVERTLELDVSEGDAIDLALDPTGTNGAGEDFCDRCALRLTITRR